MHSCFIQTYLLNTALSILAEIDARFVVCDSPVCPFCIMVFVNEPWPYENKSK